MTTPKPRPFPKPQVAKPQTQSKKDDKHSPVKKQPFVPRDGQPLLEHKGLADLLEDLGGVEKLPARPRKP